MILEVVDLGPAEDEHATAVRCSGQPVSARPGFWIRGTRHGAREPVLPDDVHAELGAVHQLRDRDRHLVLGVLGRDYVVHRVGGTRPEAGAGTPGL